jgi:cell division protein FtsL
MAKRRVTFRGRSIAALVLAGFVLAATGVISRRSHGMAQREVIERLRQERDRLVAERESLERSITTASSVSRLAPIAEQRLKLSVATGSQLVILPRRSPRDSP